MVASEVRIGRRMKIHGIDAAKVQRVRRSFQRGVRAAHLLQIRKHAEQVQRFRRGVHGGQNFPAQLVFNGSNQRCGLARCLQHGVN